MKKYVCISTTGATAILFLAAVLVGCSSKKKAAPATAPVAVAKSFATNLPLQIQPPPVGHAEAFSTVTVHSQIGGILQQVHFQEGTEVKSNELLFTIDPRQSQAALDQARANLERDSGQLEFQKANYSRDQQLLAAKIISKNQLDTDKASLDAATGTVAADQAAITNAELNLQFCEIRAPFDGVTGALQKHEGDVVKAPDDTLVTLNQIHPIYVQFAVPEQFLSEIKRQTSLHPLKMSASFQNMNGSPPQGELTFIDNTVDAMTGTIQLRGTFANRDNALWPGQFVTVDLTLTELTNAIVAPTPAVQTGPNGEFIYVVKPDQTVEARPVTIGIQYDGETEIKKGLRAGETVVTDGQLRLAPGVKVNVKTAEAAETNSAPGQ